jgi:hypothetical protein
MSAKQFASSGSSFSGRPESWYPSQRWSKPIAARARSSSMRRRPAMSRSAMAFSTSPGFWMSPRSPPVQLTTSTSAPEST